MDKIRLFLETVALTGIANFMGVAVITYLLWRILNVLNILEGKIEHPDCKPMNEKRWGWGKKDQGI